MRWSLLIILELNREGSPFHRLDERDRLAVLVLNAIDGCRLAVGTDPSGEVGVRPGERGEREERARVTARGSRPTESWRGQPLLAAVFGVL